MQPTECLLFKLELLCCKVWFTRDDRPEWTTAVVAALADLPAWPMPVALLLLPPFSRKSTRKFAMSGILSRPLAFGFFLA